jgi:hypothetical protein
MSNKQTFNSYIRNKQSFDSTVRNKQSFSSYIKNKQSFDLFIDGFVPSTSWILRVVVPPPTLAVNPITSAIDISVNMIVPTIAVSWPSLLAGLAQGLSTTIDIPTTNITLDMKMAKSMELLDIVLNLTTSFILQMLWSMVPIVITIPAPKLEFNMTQTESYMLSVYDPDLLSVWDGTLLSDMDGTTL